MANQPQGTHEHVDDEAFIIVKAAPRASRTYGETVCIAAVDRSASWQRLYPVSFRYLDDAKKFGRWDRIKYRWRRPRAAADRRTESRRVDADSITIVGRLPDREHHSLINRLAVTSLKREREFDRSLAMLKCDQIEFRAVRRSRDQMEAQRVTYEHIRAQTDMFAEIARFVPREPSPFSFSYRYQDDDGWHDGECQDWETEATFMKRLHEGRSERESLDWMYQKFGDEFPRLGMALAMGTHRRRADQWLINGIIRYDPSAQQSLI